MSLRDLSTSGPPVQLDFLEIVTEPTRQLWHRSTSVPSPCTVGDTTEVVTRSSCSICHQQSHVIRGHDSRALVGGRYESLYLDLNLHDYWKMGPMALSLPGATRRERILKLLTILGRLAFLLRISRLVFLDGYRHVRARGIVLSATDIYASIQSVCIIFPHCSKLMVSDLHSPFALPPVFPSKNAIRIIENADRAP
jgi:hypothetical protein